MASASSAPPRLGFESPQYVTIHRSEWLARNARCAGRGGVKRPSPPRPGKVVEISDAQMRLRIQTPPKIPVCCNGAPAAGLDAERDADAGEAHSSRAVHYVTCRKGDRITICNNITIAALDFHRFVLS